MLHVLRVPSTSWKPALILAALKATIFSYMHLQADGNYLCLGFHYRDHRFNSAAINVPLVPSGICQRHLDRTGRCDTRSVEVYFSKEVSGGKVKYIIKNGMRSACLGT